MSWGPKEEAKAAYIDAHPDVVVKVWLVPHGYQVRIEDHTLQRGRAMVVADWCRDFSGSYPVQYVAGCLRSALAQLFRQYEPPEPPLRSSRRRKIAPGARTHDQPPSDLVSVGDPMDVPGDYRMRINKETAETTCHYCGVPITYDQETKVWVDETDGDGCAGNDDLENENESHTPTVR